MTMLLLTAFTSFLSKAVARDDEILLVQDANFDPANQMQIDLSENCQAAVSLDHNLPNQYCQGNCVGWEEEYLNDDEFYASCQVDPMMAKFGIGNDMDYAEEPSHCFSPFSPQLTHVIDQFDVDFPLSCQNACQDREGCVWMTVVRFLEGEVDKFRCLLSGSDALSNPLAMIASGDVTLCGMGNGEPVDCGIGSNMCLMDARDLITPMDMAILRTTKDKMQALSGPKFCRASSNSVEDAICGSADMIFRSYVESGYVSEALDEAFDVALEKFYGNDHLLGAGSFFNERQWNLNFPDEPREQDPDVDSMFIDLKIAELMETIKQD